MKRILFTILILIFLSPQGVYGQKKTAAQEFTERYNEAAAKGGRAFTDFATEVTNKGTDAEVEMLRNLGDGKTADGKPLPANQKDGQPGQPKGFMGDPKDPGPKDWSDWNIKTDGNGNVIGFEEKDFEEKDADGDGEISKEEREEWDKKKKEEHEKSGGAPGEVPPVADWDKDGDGIPDVGFQRWCWQCCPGQDALNECQDGRPGGCPGSCPKDQECREHKERYDGRELTCHNCSPKDKEEPAFCEKCGRSSDPKCAGQCPPVACAALDIDTKTCEIVPTMRTRERGSTQKCYSCMENVTVEVTYIVIIIETPAGRYILDNSAGAQMAGFVPSQVMALAKVADPQQAVKQIAGMFPGASNAFAALNTSMSMSSLSGLLQQGMDKGRKYSDDCFEKDFDQQPLESTPPVSAPAPEQSKKKSKAEGPPMERQPQEFGQDPTKNMSTGGPIVSCGSLGNEKALAILDAHGRPVDMITQAMLKSNPNAIMEGLQKAQRLSDQLLALREGNMQGILQMLGQKTIDKVTTKVQKAAEGSDDSKNAAPNDPFYPEPIEKKKKRLLGIFGSTKGTPQIVIGSSMRRGDTVLGADSGSKKEETVKYQWGLHQIGYTPYDDPASAWNLVDEETRNIVVAVIDSGIDLNHPDGPAYIWKNEGEIPGNGIDDDNNGYVDDVHGWNFLDNNNDLTDKEGHGTFVAGIIAAKKDNGIGIAGINPGAVIMPIKAADGDGATNSFAIARAIFYAVDNGARIINLSLGARVPSQLEDAALQYAFARGVFVAVASGNVGENIGDHGPASSKGAFSVGSLDIDGNRSTISNWGPNNALIAPGEEIYSLLATGTGKKVLPSLQKQGYYPRSGTSFSTPMVAATASLLLVQNPHLTNLDIEDILHRTAVELYNEGWDGESGAGILDATAALSQGVNDRITLKINETRKNADRKGKIDSVDVFGTVRGEFKEFTIELGKGKHAGKFKQVAGPFSRQATFDWLAQLSVQEHLKGSKEWIVRIRAVDQNGKEHLAQTLLEL